MNTLAKPHIDCEQHHATLSVSDVRAAADFYANKFGFTVAFTQGEPPTFAGVNLGHTQIFLNKGTPAPQGCSVYFVGDDAAEQLDSRACRRVSAVARRQRRGDRHDDDRSRRLLHLRRPRTRHLPRPPGPESGPDSDDTRSSRHRRHAGDERAQCELWRVNFANRSTACGVPQARS